MVEVRTGHTSALAAGELAAIRRLLDEAFDGDFGDDDFDHSLGGMHALVFDGSELIAHGAVVLRRLLHNGESLRTGYVEGVAVVAHRRREGHASAVMNALERVVQGGYELGALSASNSAAQLYAGRGWQCWPGTASVVSPTGVQRLPDEEGAIYLLPVTARLDPTADLACDWRDGDVW